MVNKFSLWMRRHEIDVILWAIGAVLVLGIASVGVDLQRGGVSDVVREFGDPVRMVGPADRAVEDADECFRTRNGLVLCVLDDDGGARVVRVVGVERGI